MEKEFIKYEIPSLHMKINNYKMVLGHEYRGIHIHNATELIFVEKGEVLCYINQEKFVLKENDTILINSYTVHYIEYISDANITVIQVDIIKFADMLISKNISYIDEFIIKARSKEYYIANGEDELFQIVTKIKNELEREQKCYDKYVKSYLFQLAAFMFRNEMLLEENHSVKENLNELLPAIEFINQNYNRRLFLDEICSCISYNKYHLCRVFKDMTGGTVFDYINYVRLRNAEELLCSTSKSISEVAFECGFASIQYFSRAFKKSTGYSPGRFKKLV